MIYLDYNATTPIDKKVAEAMEEYIYGNFGNPSSSHELGSKTKQAVEEARKKVASLLNASPEEIIFTSGGSESNNMVLKGVGYTYQNRGKHIITSEIEHPAVISPCKFLEGNGYEVTYLSVDQDRAKGQLVFTSHNLRPLEKLNKESLIFTTTNPKNRYIRFTNVKETNNLRSFYYREIKLGGQDEEVYKKTEKHRIAKAFRTDQTQ